MMERNLRIGDLAKRAGLSVRALRHYEQLGLLAKVPRSFAGQRLYGREDLESLARVQALKALGLPLTEIGQVLQAGAEPITELINRQLVRVESELTRTKLLRERLQGLSRMLKQHPVPSSDTLLHWIEVTTMFEQHFTKEQLDALQKRKELLGPEKIEAVKAEWPALLEKARAHMVAGDDPAGEAMVAVGRRWKELVDAFTGGDPEIAKRTAQMYQAEPARLSHFRLDSELVSYVQKAIEASAASAPL